MTIYIGIDWSEAKHDVVFMNEAGAVLGQLEMSHTPAGLQNFEKTRRYLGVERTECMIALETSYNLVLDFLWAQGYPQIYVIPPSVIKSCGGRYGSSGARTDPQDGRLIADVLRTDRHRLQPWQPDGLLTRQMAVKVSLVRHLTQQSTRWSNRLRAVLLRYYPAALTVFGSLTSQIALHFIIRYPTPQAAANLTWTEFEASAQQQGYPHRQKLPQCFARLQQPYPDPTPETILVYQGEAKLLAQLLLPVVQAKGRNLRALADLFENHPDHLIFASLPGTGDLLGAGLLSKFGDDRARFPTAASVQALAGTCPVTDRSGKRTVIRFRRGCDREFRWIVQQWALNSLKDSVWANAYWQQVRPNCRTNNHAYRCLGNRWLAIAWKLWQTKQLYDEAYHLQQRKLRSKPHR